MEFLSADPFGHASYNNAETNKIQLDSFQPTHDMNMLQNNFYDQEETTPFYPYETNFNNMENKYSGYEDFPEPEEEEATELTKFMNDWEEKLLLKHQEQEKVVEALKVQAEKDFADFIANRDLQRENKQAANRIQEQNKLEEIVANMAAENPWERVARLVDLTVDAKMEKQKNPDNKTARMKQLFIHMKNEPKPFTA